MGTRVGPPLADGLKAALGKVKVAAEGVDYAALLATNFVPGGADHAGVSEMCRLVKQAEAQCPEANILVSGTGAAMVHRVVEALDAATVACVAGVVTFNDTQNLQDRGAIAGLPAEKLLIICNVGDAVCHGLLTIQPPHLDHTHRVPEAVDFFLQRLRATAAATANDTVAAGAYASKT